MAINFPNSPTLDSQFSAGDRTWLWNGTYWEAISTTVGYSGSQGNLGYTGSAGTGYTGSTGTQGSVGFTGSTGTQGSVGFTGSTGTQGNIGFTGSIGYTGSRGIDGVTTTTTIASVTTLVGTTSTTAGIPGFSTKIYNGSLNDGYTLTNGDLYVWKGGDSAGSTATTVEYLVVAGGGAGAYGGGGAGGVLTTSGYVVAAGSPVSLSVGDGGVGANGGNSTFASFTAIGGGRGGSSGAGAGAAGGSGGGASYDYGNASAGAGAGTAGQGNRGGYGSSGAGDASAGGGGGAGAVGTGGYANGTNLASGSTGAGGGAGGIGLLSSISGTPTYYGGGGGGGGNINGANIGNAAPGGLGGGGNGATTAGMPNQAGTDGTANTGGGGGGGDPEVGSANFKRGGSGIVIIRYADTYPVPAATTGSPTVLTTSGYRIYSWTTVGSGSITFANSSPVTGQGWVLVGNIKGIPGEYAAIGYTGSSGSTGTQGTVGFTGSTGTQGNVGFTGSAGSIGFTGSTGTQGNIGFTGSTGTQGSIGFTGYSGSLGYTGSAGSTGTVGFTGSRGIDGVTTTTTIAATIVGTTSTTAGIPGYSTKIYAGSLNDGYTLTNGDLYVWKGGDIPGAGPTVEYLVIAGGGGGGFGASSSSGGGGGGAGGYRSSVVGESSGRNTSAESALSVIAGTVYTIAVGAGGGTGASGGARGINGSTSSFSTIVSIGGGGGGGSAAGAGGSDAARSGSDGGSGGGAAGINPNTNNYGGAGTIGQGYAGGDSLSPAAPNYPSAGGGGAGSVGGSQVNQTTGGNGGSGLSSSITGTPTIRGGGGGGATYAGGTPGTGGSGGGGAAGNPTGAVVGTPNTGGGGGGGTNGTPGAAGGSGIVVVRYPDSYSTATSTTGTPTAVTTSGYRIYSWTTVGSGSITFPAGATVTGQGWVFVGNIKGISGEYAAIGYTGSAGSAGSAGSTGPKITSVTVTDSSYNNLDDTAVALTGGYIKIAGSGFESGCQVLLGTTLATSVSYISSTEVRAQLPAASTGTYIIYLVNADGGTAIRVNAVTFSSTPAWTTGAALAGAADTAISIQLAATDATSYSVAAGSSLPSGITLSSGGLLSGTITGLSANTTYNFTIIATDAELQDSTRAFTFEITVGDTYFKYATMLLAGNGINLAQNNTIIDSSSNNFSITRAGNVSQGTFTPYGSNWSNYFDGAGDTVSAASDTSLIFGTGDFTVECWFNSGSQPGSYNTIIGGDTAGSLLLSITGIGTSTGVYVNVYGSGSPVYNQSYTVTQGIWFHLAATRSGTSFRVFVNGTQLGATVTDSTNFSAATRFIGGAGNSNQNYSGYVSNARLVKGTAVYTSNFTPSTTPLTPIANTSLLTCQSNRFIDNSTNAFAITVSGNTNVQRYSPFSPSAVYSTSTIGGSGYFDGSGDSLTSTSAGIPPALSFLNGASDTGTIECWAYVNSVPAQGSFVYSFPPIIALGSTYFSMGVTAAKKFRFYWWIGSATSFDSTIDVNLGCWNHLVAVRSGSTVYLYVNGQPAGSNAMTGISWASAAEGTNLYIGYTNPGSLHYLNGYVSNLRVVNGTAVYTSSFTPPTSPVTAITNTALLLNFTNAGVIDNTMINNLETVGDAKISTAQSKFGSGSLLFDGSGDLLTRPNDPLFDLSSGDFTVEFWFNTTTLTPSGGSSAGYGHILGKHNWNGGSGAGWGIWQFNQTIIFFWPTSALNPIQTGNVITATATWYYITVVRSGTATNNTKIYINGVQQAQGTPSVTNSTSPLTIGGTNATYGWDSGYYTAGYIDDIRITKGYARYTTTFTPPTAAHPLK